MENFNVKGYRKYNPDIAKESDEWLKKHYLEHGAKEGRIYSVNLPKDFNLEVYKLANPDLKDFSDSCLEKHFALHGIREGRVYKDSFFDQEYFIHKNKIVDYKGYVTYVQDIRKPKSPILDFYIQNLPFIKTSYVLVNHNNSNNGATHSLYTLYNFLKNKNKRVLILECGHNKKLASLYNIPIKDTINYHGDPFLLYWLCQKIRCEKIIFNSINFAMSQAMKWLDRTKLILFSREIKKHYMSRSCWEPDFVLSNSISQSYDSKPSVQPPIILREHLEKIEQDSKQLCNIEKFDSSKITLGMCGIIGERKNSNLFLRVAEQLPNFNFVWIGGKELTTKLSNVFHIKDNTEVGKYFSLLDYFVLFSQDEPFGKVVIENLYIGNRVLTFRDNIYYDHKHEKLKDTYYEFPGSITKTNAIQHILSTCKEKKTNANEFSKQYVLENFVSYASDFIKALNLWEM